MKKIAKSDYNILEYQTETLFFIAFKVYVNYLKRNGAAFKKLDNFFCNVLLYLLQVFFCTYLKYFYFKIITFVIAIAKLKKQKHKTVHVKFQ